MAPLALCLLLLAAPYKTTPGPSAVAQAALVELDGLQLRVTWPKGEGKCPVLVFSHGLWGSRTGYEPLVRYWASFGYICLQPDHADSRALGRMQRNEAMMAWSRRPKQVTRLLDSFQAIEKEVPELKGRLDASRIAVGGHSYGAHTTQLVAGVRPYPFKSFSDKRIKAFLLLSPQGAGGLFRGDSWKDVKRPVLVLTGSEDKSPFEPDKKNATWRLGAYENLPPGDKYLVFIDGAHHGFGGISGAKWRGSGPKIDDHVRIVQQTCLAFLDAHVRGDETAKKWLASDAPGTAWKSNVRYERK